MADQAPLGQGVVASFGHADLADDAAGDESPDDAEEPLEETGENRGSYAATS